jgi:cytosine/adenosine deaminase-related metal-dependent hydrolase
MASTRILLKTGATVTMDGDRRVLRGGGLIVRGTVIERVLSRDELSSLPSFEGAVVDATRLTVIPGFVQTHIHLCQTLFRGLADDLPLLDWLSLRIFPFEAAHTAASMRASAMIGIVELLRSGTTTIMDMGSVHHEEEIVAAIDGAGLRAFVGKAMMDRNDAFPKLKEPTEESLRSTLREARAWHGAAGGRLMYAVAPRFVLSCTDQLLRGAHEMLRDFPGMLFHTHAAENAREMEAVRARCGMDNIEFFESMGILGASTCLAHCIWLNQKEIGLLRDRKVKVLHCPSSNLKLGSGVADIPGYLAHGIAVSLGSDGAPCNNTLDMFGEMRLAALIQKPGHGPAAMDAPTVFALATIGGARALGIEAMIGSIEAGKKADLTFLDLDRVWNPADDDHIYSAIVYSGSPENVHSVMIDGAWVYRDGTCRDADEGELFARGRNELRLLLQRV